MHTKQVLEEEIITAFANTIELFGLTTLESRLFAHLYLVNEPQTLDEMSEALGKSKTAMSTSIRNLANLNLVTQVWKKGVRKDLYIANSQLFKVFMNFYFRKWVDKTEQQMAVLNELAHRMDQTKGKSGDTKQLEERLKEIIEFHEEIEVAFNGLKDGNQKQKDS